MATSKIPTADLDAISRDLEVNVQQISDFVAMAFSARLNHQDRSSLPTSSPQHMFSVASLERSNAEARFLFRRWATRAGVRDLVETVSLAVESAYGIYLRWDATLDVLAIEKKQKAFHKLGFPGKLEELTNRHGFSFSPRAFSEAESINRLRNCLVHRLGIVSEHDTQSGQFLLSSWRSFELFQRRADGVETILTRKTAYEPTNGEMFCRYLPHERRFSVGDSVNISAQDFADICWTMHNFGVIVLRALRDVGRVSGQRMLARGKEFHGDRT